MIVSQHMIDDLQVLAHQAEMTDTNIPFTGRQIREIIRIIIDIRGKIIDSEGELDKYAKRIVELEKDLHMLQRHYDQLDHDLPNAEPVAWMTYPENSTIDWFVAYNYDPTLKQTPLYTTPIDQADRIAELEKELLYTKTMQGVTFK